MVLPVVFVTAIVIFVWLWRNRLYRLADEHFWPYFGSLFASTLAAILSASIILWNLRETVLGIEISTISALAAIVIFVIGMYEWSYSMWILIVPEKRTVERVDAGKQP